MALALLATFANGCSPSSNEPADPKRRLIEYVDRSFKVKDPAERNELLAYLTGETKTRLAAWSDAQFREAFIDAKRVFIKLSFQEVKAISPTEVSITYELVYIDETKGKEAKITNKKLCQMVQENGQWLIRDVKNIKELVEFKDAVSLP